MSKKIIFVLIIVTLLTTCTACASDRFYSTMPDNSEPSVVISEEAKTTENEPAQIKVEENESEPEAASDEPEESIDSSEETASESNENTGVEMESKFEEFDIASYLNSVGATDIEYKSQISLDDTGTIELYFNHHGYRVQLSTTYSSKEMFGAKTQITDIETGVTIHIPDSGRQVYLLDTDGYLAVSKEVFETLQMFLSPNVEELQGDMWGTCPIRKFATVGHYEYLPDKVTVSWHEDYDAWQQQQ